MSYAGVLRWIESRKARNKSRKPYEQPEDPTPTPAVFPRDFPASTRHRHDDHTAIPGPGDRLLRKVERPSAGGLVPCFCALCAGNPGGIIVDDKSVPGAFVTPNQRAAHRRMESRRQAVERKFNYPSAETQENASTHEGGEESMDVDPPSHVENRNPGRRDEPTPETSNSPPSVRLVQPSGLEDGEGDKVAALDNLLSKLRSPKAVQSSYATLVFASPPHLSPRPLSKHPTDEEIDFFCRLDRMSPANSDVILYLDFLAEAVTVSRRYLHDQGSASARVKSCLLLETAQQYQKEARQKIAKGWMRQHALKTEDHLVDTSRFFVNPVQLISPILLVNYLMVACLYLLSNVSQKTCGFLLGCLSISLNINALSSTAVDTQISSKNLLKTIEPVVKLLDLKPRVLSFVCCRNASISTETGKSPPITPRKALHTFTYQSPYDYLAHLFSRSDLKDYLYSDPLRRSRPSEAAHDIWDADALRDFNFSDGTPFTASQKESRLVFSLNMDGLNPYGNKTSGKVVGVGAIYMVCLNLPPEIRYNLENVYLVGVIPGPGQPSLQEINKLLKPLVDDFLVLWNTGVYLSRTFLRPQGVRVRCAIVPLVCDLPAARQMSGFASYSHTYFCSECKLRRSDINDLDCSRWPLRTSDDHRAAAFEWRDAPTQAARKRLYKSQGVRWSELLRLPYWDPTKYTLIDSMHAFYLRLFQHHVRTIWGMDIKLDDTSGVSNPDTFPPTEPEMEYGHFVLRHGSRARLAGLRKDILRQLCIDTGVLSFDGTAAELCDRLLDFRIEEGWWTVDDKHIVDGAPPKIANYQLLKDGSTTDDFFWHASKTRATGTKKGDLKAIFLRHVRPFMRPMPSTEDVDKWKREDLLSKIQGQRHALGIIDEDGIHVHRVVASGPKNQQNNILGYDALKEIRRDMRTINRPSWQPNGPGSPGESRYGKFTAAQWRTFCLINLPVTLIKRWGSSPKDSFEWKALDNFMHLVTAVKLATMNVMSESRIQAYQHHMSKYLASLLELYPKAKITPYQHLALHFPRHLRLFGPVHAWRCFAFERYNHIIQSLPTNHKFGQLEQTMVTKFCSAQRLRAIFAQSEKLPALLAPMVEHFRRAYDKESKMDFNQIFLGTEDSSSNRGIDPTPLDADTFRAFQTLLARLDPMCLDPPRRVFFKSSVSRFAQVFSISTRHQNNSQIIYQQGEGWAAGTILNIFSHARTSNGQEIVQTFAIVSRYTELSVVDAPKDLYRQWTTAAGRLVYNTQSPETYIIPFSDVISHFVSQVKDRKSFEHECLLALPLDRH